MMERELVDKIASSTFKFASFVMDLSCKLRAEGRESTTEREATEIAERLEAVRQAAQLPKSIEPD